MKKSSDGSVVDIDASVDSAIQATERHYREQIFSSGCSSLVAIYRISDHATTSDALVKQLQGSPYIQRDVEFSARVIETFLEIQLYRYQNWHFFFQGDMQTEVLEFIETQCAHVQSFSQVVQQEASNEPPKWTTIDKSIDILVREYPILTSFDFKSVLAQIMSIVCEIKFDGDIQTYLQILQNAEWTDKLQMNQSVLLCMVATANSLGLDTPSIKDLVTLGILKDIGYARLNDQIADFEVLHPLVSHKLLIECNEACEDSEKKISPSLLDSILTHHEFVDGSGPLARMRHPQVVGLIGDNMPKCAQISGLCDLFFGFLEKYSPGVAFAITCGFVLGQGDVQPRYSADVIEAFASTLKEGSYGKMEILEAEAEKLVMSILNLLKDPAVQKKAVTVVLGKSNSWYERITLALNIVRNIARRQPDQLGEESLIDILHLPVEFGLNY